MGVRDGGVVMYVRIFVGRERTGKGEERLPRKPPDTRAGHSINQRLTTELDERGLVEKECGLIIEWLYLGQHAWLQP